MHQEVCRFRFLMPSMVQGDRLVDRSSYNCTVSNTGAGVFFHCCQFSSFAFVQFIGFCYKLLEFDQTVDIPLIFIAVQFQIAHGPASPLIALRVQDWWHWSFIKCSAGFEIQVILRLCVELIYRRDSTLLALSLHLCGYFLQTCNRSVTTQVTESWCSLALIVKVKICHSLLL